MNMAWPRARNYVLSSLLSVVGIALASAQMPVTTWHYDNMNSGANASETILTPQNVNKNSFGQLFTQSVDGAIVGQALYLPHVTIPGAGVHNVVYVATMNDSVYAFDADSASAPLWHTSFLSKSVNPMPGSLQGCTKTTGWTQVGIVSTPVIDPVAGTIYIVAKTYEHKASFVHRLHALDVATGLERTGSPVVITASYEYNGQNDVFVDEMQVNRPALRLNNGTIYIAFGSNGCRSGKEEGWVVAYNSSTLQQAGAFDVVPEASAAAIWQRGGGLAADSDGYIYGATADGPFTSGIDLGQSVFKISQGDGTLTLADWFTPWNEVYLNQHDMDLSEPVLILPDQTGAYPHLAAAIGKEGTIYLLNRDNLGQFCDTCQSGDDQIPQELQNFAPNTGALVYWNNAIYTSANSAPIAGLPFANGVIGTTPFALSRKVAAGHSPIVTSNGASNGILWQLNGKNLCAYDAGTLAELYQSSKAKGRDQLPVLPHFANIMAANGKLYVGTNNSLVVFGLLQ
ncbi:MAG: hypothetical protein ACRD3Q_19265 [Terriglobales bacterium]